MRHPKLTLTLAALLTAACAVARADYLTNHSVGHGPLSAAGSMPTWGDIEMCCTPAGGGERWLGDVAGGYSAYPTAGQVWIRRSPGGGTYAVAYEHASYPWGRTYVMSSSWAQLAWSPALVTIQYDDACPLTPGMAIAHMCGTDWTPMDSGGVPTYVIGNNIVKPGLPYGDYLKDTSGTGAGPWCSFNFSDFTGVTKPAGAPNHGVAIDACP